MIVPPYNEHLKIKRQLRSALEPFLLNDSYLLINDLHERSITFRLGLYLQQRFRSWNVDCEYNKEGVESKRLMTLPHHAECSKPRDDGYLVYPDIIIHRRGNQGPNLLALEMKKTTTGGCRDCDKEKLTAYLCELQYRHAVFVEFEAGTQEPQVREIEWRCH